MGTLSAKVLHTSKIYDGMKSEYWIYVPAQYDPKVAAALMVFQDGGGYIRRDGNDLTLNVIDNHDCAKENSGDDCGVHQSRRHQRFARHADLQFCEGVFGQVAPQLERLHAQHFVRHR